MRYLERVTHPARELGINKSERLLNLTIALMSIRSGLTKTDIFSQIPIDAEELRLQSGFAKKSIVGT